MIAVIAVLSFIMAFGAIWFTSEALKRVDSYNDACLRPHLMKIHQAVEEVNETLASLKGRLDLLEKKAHILRLNADLPPVIEQEAGALHADINKTRHYSPSIRLNG
jgi:hypothetical protein